MTAQSFILLSQNFKISGYTANFLSLAWTLPIGLYVKTPCRCSYKACSNMALDPTLLSKSVFVSVMKVQHRSFGFVT